MQKPDVLKLFIQAAPVSSVAGMCTTGSGTKNSEPERKERLLFVGTFQ